MMPNANGSNNGADFKVDCRMLYTPFEYVHIYVHGKNPIQLDEMKNASTALEMKVFLPLSILLGASNSRIDDRAYISIMYI